MSDTMSNFLKVKIDGRTHKFQLPGNRVDLSSIVRKHTAFTSFEDLLSQKGYRPSIYLGGKPKKAQRELLTLSLAYNQAQAARGDSREVFQGDWEVQKEKSVLA